MTELDEIFIMCRIVLLTYHRVLLKKDIMAIDLPSKRIYTIDSETFEEHCKYLSNSRFKTITFKKLKKCCKTDNRKKVILTFDDGFVDNYRIAYPILRKYNLLGVFFICTKFVNSKGYMSWEQIKEMKKNGMEFQSHTHSHLNLEVLNTEELHYEFYQSKILLEKYISGKVNVIALPYGSKHNEIQNIATLLGYDYICTSNWGINKITDDTKNLKRFSIKNNYSFNTFKDFVEGKMTLPLVMHLIKDMLLRYLRKLLGKSRYDRIRGIILNKLVRAYLRNKS